MASKGLDKVKGLRAVDPPPERPSEKNTSLETYLRNSLHDLDPAARDFRGLPSSSRYVPNLGADPDDRNDDEWAESFQTNVKAKPRPKKLLGSILSYVIVALLCGAASGGTLLYFLLRYSQPSAEVASVAPEAAHGETTSRPPAQNKVSNSAVSASPSNASPAAALFDAESTPSEAARSEAHAPPLGGGVDANTTHANDTGASAKMAALPPAVAAAPSPPPAPSLKQEPKPVQSAATLPQAALSWVSHPKLPADQEEKMLKRGAMLLSQNDVAGARLVFQYLASHASASGALALAESYDPKKLAGRHIAGVTPDVNLAWIWYARAAEAGSKEAAAVLRIDKP